MKRIFLTTLAAAAALGGFAPASARAQSPTVFHACYVPSSGTVYRIKEPGTPQQCGTSTKKGVTVQHVEFSWTDAANALFATTAAGGDLTGPLASPTVAKLLGRALSAGAPADGNVLTWDAAANEWQAKAPASGGGGGTSDHGALAGLADDDHAQYLLADGVRNSTNGFAITGTAGTGTIPASGAGARLMWYPKKAAFRVGEVPGNEWDDPNIGQASVGLGAATVASGDYSVALGVNARAGGLGAIALGQSSASAFGSAALAPGSQAQGSYSVGIGWGAVAAADNSFAIGTDVRASGDYSMALGRRADTDGKTGAFAWGDASNPNGLSVKPVANNQFVVRATRFWFGINNNVTASIGRFIETSTGAFLSSGGTWTNSSDAAKKTAFQSVDGESVLAKLAALPVSTWSYRDEEESARHMGPTAQDFQAAFQLGSTDKAIATVDADGVSLAAIKALIARTDGLGAEIRELMAVNAKLEQSIDALHREVARLQTELARFAASK